MYAFASITTIASSRACDVKVRVHGNSQLFDSRFYYSAPTIGRALPRIGSSSRQLMRPRAFPGDDDAKRGDAPVFHLDLSCTRDRGEGCVRFFFSRKRATNATSRREVERERCVRGRGEREREIERSWERDSWGQRDVRRDGADSANAGVPTPFISRCCQ